jgi:uncharacterized membrane protein
MAKTKKESKQSIENEKLCAILSYLVIGIVWFFADEKMKKSSFAKFHVKQAIILVIVDIIFWVISGIPFIGWTIMPILNLAILILIIIGVVNAANDKENKLPLIGDFAEKLTF